MLREDVEYCLTYAKNWEQLRNNFNRPFQASAMTLLLKNRKYNYNERVAGERKSSLHAARFYFIKIEYLP